MPTSSLKGEKRRELPVEPPKSLPTGARIYRRPSPPPSQSDQDSRNTPPQRLPMEAPPLDAPPVRNNPELTPEATSHAPATAGLKVTRLLILASFTVTIALGIVLAIVIWLPHYEDTVRFATSEDLSDSLVVKPIGTESAPSPEQESSQDHHLTWAQPMNLSYSDPPGSASLSDRGDEEGETQGLAGAELLADRFYELQWDEQGRIVSVRMPVDGYNRRFGPAQDEITALKELPDLQRLDLRDTIASAAVPIANRLPRLKILVLEKQTDWRSLKELVSVEELHLIDSEIDAQTLSVSGIRVVELPAS